MSLASRLVARSRSVYYGWWIVIASSVLLTYHAGAWWYSFTVMLKPIAEEFNWNRASVAGAFSLTNLEGGFLGILTGWLIDRFGPRVVALGGVVILALGFVSLSRIDSLLGFYLTYGLLMGVGAHAAGIHTYMAAAARWFIRKRSRAMGYVSVGAGVGGVIVTPVVAVLVEAIGWRATAQAIALGFLVIGLPAAAVIRPGRPEAYGLRADGDRPEPPSVPSDPGSPPMAPLPDGDSTVRDALKSRTFWLLVAAWGLSGASTTAVAVHMVPLFTDRGIPTSFAAAAVSILTLGTVPSRVIFPFIAERFELRHAYAASVLFYVAGLVVLLLAPNLVLAYLAVGMLGLGQGGAIPLRPSATAGYFGRSRFATIQGWMSAFGSIGTMLGPIVAGAIFDATGSYGPALLLFSALGLVAAATVASAPSLPNPPAEARVAAAVH